MPIHSGQILKERYRIVKLLGEGDFGAVYRAWDLNMERPCAIKENLDPPHRLNANSIMKQASKWI